MRDVLDVNRRAVLGVAAFTTTLAGVSIAAIARAGSAEAAIGAPTAGDVAAVFAAPKQIAAGALDVGYVELGPRHGQAIVLLHGWPYDIHSYVEVAPLLAAQGYRVIVPYLRGYGTTRFLAPDTPRNGQQAAIGADILALVDALHIERAIFAGFDWGARTAVIMGALWPERTKAVVSVSGYIIASIEANRAPLPPRAELGWWYQYYFATERGRLGYTQNTHDFAKLIWQIASPKWQFDDATFDRSAAAFQNPDHAEIVVHNYRWRLGLADGEARYADLEARLQHGPAVMRPTVTIGSDFDGVNVGGQAYRAKFTGPYAHRVLEGIGHNVPQEAPQAFVDAVIAADRL